MSSYEGVTQAGAVSQQDGLGGHVDPVDGHDSALPGRSPAFLITLFQNDHPGILRNLLRRLAEPKHVKWTTWGIFDFNVEASITASLSQIAAVALVVRPLPLDEVGSQYISSFDEVQLDLMASAIDAELKSASVDAAGTAEHATAADAGALAGDVPDVRVVSLGYGSEAGLYAGRQFREIRFGLSGPPPERPAMCGKLLRQFARELAARDTPIAYVHFPRQWKRSGDPGAEYLCIAYAVLPDIGVDAAIEMRAWQVAVEIGASLAFYDPAKPGSTMSERFTFLRRAAPSGVTHAPLVEGRSERVGLCAEGEARSGLVATVLGKTSDIEIEGCTIAVLYGRTVLNIISRGDSVDGLQSVLKGELGPPHRFDQVPTFVEIVPRVTDFTFWVSWVCHEQAGAILMALGAIDGEFKRSGLPVPNILYGTSRVLVDGRSCAAKYKFQCSEADATTLGLREAGAAGSPDVDMVAGSEGAKELITAIRAQLALPSTTWRPSNRSWIQSPVHVTKSEPREEPWATLSLPHGDPMDVSLSAFLTPIGPG